MLSLKGRLIKDQGVGIPFPERRSHLLAAATAYGAAGEISGATYPLINAATLALLAGDADQARERATRLLTRIDAAGDDPDETPYYALATRAEALLLVGETALARAALEAAVALAPRAWEDHASTLRQFALILAELGEDAGWLEALRPPAVLHFGGAMGLAGDPEGAVAAWLKRERIGFGYGALAAGADILIAEALVAAGARLNVVLPCPVEVFREVSVRPYGDDWVVRFDSLLAGCEPPHIAGSGCPAGGDPVDSESLRLAAEVAMGQAVMRAGQFATGTRQLLVVGDRPPEGSQPGGSVWMAEAWRRAGRQSDVLALPVPPSERRGGGATPQCRLLAVIDIEMANGRLDANGMNSLSAVVAGAQGRWTPSGLSLRFEGTAAAAECALAALGALGEAVRVGGAYDLAELADDPFGGPQVVLGPAAKRAARAAASAPAGAAHVTGDFAAALQASGGGKRPRVELVGELAEDRAEMSVEDPVQLYALKPAPAAP